MWYIGQIATGGRRVVIEAVGNDAPGYAGIDSVVFIDVDQCSTMPKGAAVSPPVPDTTTPNGSY